jgi:hypothetical protein
VHSISIIIKVFYPASFDPPKADNVLIAIWTAKLILILNLQQVYKKQGKDKFTYR